MNADRILDRLDKVRRIKPDSWVACCPAHADTSPSLAIADKGDRLLVHYYAGCSIDEIRAAMGLEANEFFADGKAPRPIAPGVSRRELDRALCIELAVSYVVSCDRAKGKQISPADAERERIARHRIGAAWRAAS